MFRAHVFIIRRLKLHYTASGIITPIDVILCITLVKYWDKYTEMYGQQNVKENPFSYFIFTMMFLVLRELIRRRQ